MIKVTGLSKRYGIHLAVNNVSFNIEKGEVIEEGSHEELMKKEGKYSKMFKIQAENYSLEKEA